MWTNSFSRVAKDLMNKKLSNWLKKNFRHLYSFGKNVSVLCFISFSFDWHSFLARVHFLAYVIQKWQCQNFLHKMSESAEITGFTNTFANRGSLCLIIFIATSWPSCGIRTGMQSSFQRIMGFLEKAAGVPGGRFAFGEHQSIQRRFPSLYWPSRKLHHSSHSQLPSQVYDAGWSWQLHSMWCSYWLRVNTE